MTSSNDTLVHRARLSERYHDEESHPWLAIVVGLAVVIGIAVTVFFML